MADETTFEVWAVARYGDEPELRTARPTEYDATEEATLIARSSSRAIGGGAVSVWVQRTGIPEVLWSAGEKARQPGGAS